MTNPLIGTPLHRAMKCLEEIQTHLEDDTRSDFEAARRLLPVSDRVATALDEVRAELNRRFIELRRAEKAAASKPPPPRIVLKMPGRNAPPVTYPQTKRGIEALLAEIGGTMNDKGAGIVALNHELLDKIAAAGWGPEVMALREEARDALTPAGDET
jgi:hypothetical protein